MTNAQVPPISQPSSKVTDALAMSATGGLTGAIVVIITWSVHAIWNVSLPEPVEQAIQVIVSTVIAVVTHLQLTKE